MDLKIFRGGYLQSLDISAFCWKYVITSMVLTFAMLIATLEQTWAYEAYMELYLGEAQRYELEYLERENIIFNFKEKDVIVSPFTIKPLVLYFDDIDDEVNDWKNEAVADYYGINSIVRDE